MGKGDKKKTKPPPLPPSGDTGPDTEAQRVGAQYQFDPATGAKRKFREHVLGRMARQRGNKLAMITGRQCAAGMALLEKYERTMLSAATAWTRDYVDASPIPGDVNVARLVAQARFEKINAIVPRESRPVVFQVVCEGRAIKGGITNSDKEAAMLLGMLRDGLEAVAKELSI